MNKKDKGFQKGKRPVVKPSTLAIKSGPIKLRYENLEELRKAAWRISDSSFDSQNET